MKSLQQHLEEYLTIRRSLGYKLVSAEPLLRRFVAFLDQHGATTVTTPLAVAWAQQPSKQSPYWHSKRLSIARVFAKYLQALDGSAEVPSVGLLPTPPCRATPYLYSELDVRRLMSATKQMKHPLMAATYCTVIGLLFVTGMRIGEAIHLDREDRDWKDGLLVVRNGKFGKAREICLHPTTVEVLRVYESLRDQTIPMPKHPAFFISTAGTRLIYKNVQFIFGNLVRRIGLARRSNRCRPRLHDIRHTFAVRTLTCWYAADVDVQPRLPLLSTYLGHVDPTSTYWYLTATPELVNLARQRLERSLEKLP